MTSPNSLPGPGMFSGSEISELCDAIKDVHRLLTSVGAFFSELENAEAPGGNGLQIDFKKWGLRTITENLLERQYQAVDQIVSFYREEQKKMIKKGRG